MSVWDWKSKPSELGKSHEFNGVNSNKRDVAAKNSHKASPIVLPGASKNLPPKMDSLRRTNHAQ